MLCSSKLTNCLGIHRVSNSCPSLVVNFRIRMFFLSRYPLSTNFISFLLMEVMISSNPISPVWASWNPSLEKHSFPMNAMLTNWSALSVVSKLMQSSLSSLRSSANLDLLESNESESRLGFLIQMSPCNLLFHCCINDSSSMLLVKMLPSSGVSSSMLTK